ncbi:MAG TPA: ATP-binding protein [Myxococcota bacterium]|nr:ATP-binding protein [Myxococcota bacterium]HRY94857.1 ATP-binding protein [Myxococcota bacterium]
MAPSEHPELQALVALARRLAGSTTTVEAGGELQARAQAIEARWRELEAQATDNLEQLAQAGRLAELGTLSAAVFHEMNQPLVGIKGFAELLAEQLGKAEPERLQTWAQEIRKQAQRIHELQLQVIGLLRKEPPRRTATPLAAALDEALALFRNRLDKQGVQLTTALSADLPAALVSRQHLVQILVNLVANAMDALAEAPTKAIRVAGVHDAERGRLTLVFTDSGPGVPPEVRERLFTPFFTTKGERGTGLGLFISRRLAEANGGALRLGDPLALGWRVAPGTVFELELEAQPVLSGEDLEQVEDEPTSRAAPPGPSPAEPVRMVEVFNRTLRELFAQVTVSQRMLLVDEDGGEPGGLLDIVSHHGILADVAPSGEEALERLGAKDYALLVTAPALPGMSGLELVTQTQQGWPALQRLVHGDGQHLAQLLPALETGLIDFLSRPIPNPIYASLRVQWALARYGEEIRAQTVARQLGHSCQRLAEERGRDEARSCVEPVQAALRAFRERTDTYPTLLLGPPQLAKTAEQQVRPVRLVRTAEQALEQLQAGEVQMLVVVDGEGGVDGLELAQRARAIDRRLACLLVLGEPRLESLAQILGSGSADVLLRPMEGRELFLPRFKRLVARHTLMRRYRDLLDALKSMNFHLLLGRDAPG